jgi:hypothetical protein
METHRGTAAVVGLLTLSLAFSGLSTASLIKIRDTE